MSGARVITARERNRAVLARQRLLERVDAPIEDVLDAVGGLQAQYAPSSYVGLWSRIRGFRREALTEALEARTVVQGTLMRTTIHLVSARSYWRTSAGIREGRRRWSLRLNGGPGAETALRAKAEALATALLDGPRYVKELGPEAAGGFIGHPSSWIDLVRVPPSGTWERRRADRLALAERWIGPDDATEAEGRIHLLRSYLGGFGPAPLRDVAQWAGLAVGDLTAAAGELDLVRYRDEDGRELLDLAGAPLPGAETPAPVRFLPWYETLFWVHSRRTEVLPEVHRGRILDQGNGTSRAGVAIDGRIAAAWRLEDGRVLVEPFEPLAPSVRDEVEAERQALEAFCA